MLRHLLAGLFLISLSFSYAQTANESAIALTGNLAMDSKILTMNNSPLQKQNLLPEPSDKKNPMLAGLFSLIVPGSGDFYAEHYWEAGIFAAIEVGAIAIALHYDKKGDDQTSYFQGIADRKDGWSVKRYVDFLNSKNSADPERTQYVINYTIDESKPEWQWFDWGKINEAELGSHKLPIHGTQQYYELIGKYNEYNPGWESYWPNGSSLNGSQYDPVYAQGSTVGLDQLKTYAGYRGKANDYYDYASHAVIAIYINHFLSVVDAIWSTISYNKNLSLKSNVQSVIINGKADYVSTVTMSYAF